MGWRKDRPDNLMPSHQLLGSGRRA